MGRMYLETRRALGGQKKWRAHADPKKRGTILRDVQLHATGSQKYTKNTDRSRINCLILTLIFRGFKSGIAAES